MGSGEEDGQIAVARDIENTAAEVADHAGLAAAETKGEIGARIIQGSQFSSVRLRYLVPVPEMVPVALAAITVLPVLAAMSPPVQESELVTVTIPVPPSEPDVNPIVEIEALLFMFTVLSI